MIRNIQLTTFYINTSNIMLIHCIENKGIFNSYLKFCYLILFQLYTENVMLLASSSLLNLASKGNRLICDARHSMSILYLNNHKLLNLQNKTVKIKILLYIYV